MENQFWRWFAIAFCAVNTLCVFLLLELFIFGKPYISLFFLIFGLTLFMNRHRFVSGKRKAPAPREAAPAVNPS